MVCEPLCMLACELGGMPVYHKVHSDATLRVCW